LGSIRLSALFIAIAASACDSPVEPTPQRTGVPVRIVVRPDIIRLAHGDSTRIVATAFDSAGLAVPDVTVLFSSDAATVATVDPSTGWFRTRTPGWSLVHARHGGLRDSVWVAVSMRFASVTAGAQHACAITSQHELFCWGVNNKDSPVTIGRREPFESLPTPTWQANDVAFYATGYYHACLSTTSNSTYCWGRDYEGERGDGPGMYATPQPVQLPEPLVSMSASDWSTCGITASARVFCWGENVSGELGTGFEPRSPVPTECGWNSCRTSPFEVPDMRLKSVSVGFGHVCGLDAEGRAYCWGDNSSGELGLDSVGGIMKPGAVRTAVRFKAISAGYTRTCAIAMDNAAYCWGGARHVTTPTAISSSLKFIFISVMDDACGIADSNILYCWDDGEVPAAVVPDVSFKTVSLGGYNNCALSTQDAIYCWGTRSHVGTGFPPRDFPIMIAPPGPLPSW
jgi:alpha-tubulin suppressor-like RCC1 family protein